VLPDKASIVAGVVTGVAVALAAWALAVRLPGGDEVHYLVITQSLLTDGDLKIENNHDRKDYAPYYPVDIRPDFLRRGTDGAVYSIHAPGTSVAVLPAFALFGYFGAQATFLLLAAVAGAFMWRAAWLLAGDRGAATLAWGAIVATPTFLIQSVTIFPDGLGAFVVALSLVLVVRLGTRAETVSLPSLVVLSGLLATLPWLHTRFAVLAGGLGAIALWLLLAGAGVPSRRRLHHILAFSVVPAVSAIAWFGYFQWIYGTPDPRAPYGDEPNTSLAYVPGGLLGLFLDGQLGLLTYSPILAAAFAGLLMGPHSRERRLARALTAVALSYLGASALYWMWWAGVPASPARFAAAALPIFALPIALAWRSASALGRSVLTMLAAVSLVTAVGLLGTSGGRLAWNTRGTRSAWLDWLNGVVDLSRAWPSFFWQLRPDDLASEAHFVLHAVSWAAIFSAAAAIVIYARRSPSARRDLDGAAVACALMTALTVAAQTGWWLSGTGLNPIASQLAVLNDFQSGQRVYETRRGSIGWRPTPTARAPIVAMRPARADDVGGGSVGWLPLLDVPAGRYAMTISSHRPRSGTLTLRIGRSAMPLKTLELAAVSTHTAPLVLAAGASALFLEPGGAFAGTGGTITLTPLEIFRGRGRHATSSAKYGAFDVFFYSTTVFREADGFWTRGAEITEFTVAAPDARSSAVLEIENGGVPNEVTVVSPTTTERRRLAAGERQTVAVPMTQGTVDVRLQSAAGFRWADVKGGADRRYLGVRVRMLD
jgi:hypothetical protein